MQADYGDGIYGNIEPYNEKKLKKMIHDGADSVKVFKFSSVEFNKANDRTKASKIKFNKWNKNQQKRLRKRGLNF